MVGQYFPHALVRIQTVGGLMVILTAQAMRTKRHNLDVAKNERKHLVNRNQTRILREISETHMRKQIRVTLS